MVTIKILQSPEATQPFYATPSSSGLDLSFSGTQAILIKPGERALLPTGLCLELPQGYEAQIRPRSGLAMHHGITVLNSPGTIDADYRGEIKILLINLGQQEYRIEPKTRIAQMVISRYEQATFETVTAISDSSRGTRGFGSTGQ